MLLQFLHSLTNDANHIVLLSHNILTSVSKCYYSFVSLLYLFYIICLYYFALYTPLSPCSVCDQCCNIVIICVFV